MRAVIGAPRVYAAGEKLSGPYPNIGSFPLTPSSFQLDQPIRATARVNLASGELPPSITLKDITFTLTVSDTDGTSVVLPTAVIAGPITGVRTEGTADYALEGGPFVLSQELGDKKDALLAILQGGGENNVKGVLTMDVTSTPTLPNGSSIGIWFEEGSGTVKF